MKVQRIGNATPVRTDKYFVDTNVWFWFTYCASKSISTEVSPRRYQLEQYPEFIEKVLDSGANLYHSPLAFSELANVIEKTEFNIHKLNYGDLPLKDFRGKDDLRKKVVNEIRVAWRTVNSVSECLALELNRDRMLGALKIMDESTLDPYDAIYVQQMMSENIVKVVTDDKDFVSSGLERVYTANNSLLR